MTRTTPNPRPPVPMAPEPGCVLMSARLTREGDRVVFRMRSASYTIEEIETDSLGYIRHRTEDGARTCSYHPGELLWVHRNHQSSRQVFANPGDIEERIIPLYAGEPEESR